MGYTNLTNIVKAAMANSDPAHDFEHIRRVYKLAKQIGKKEDADLSVLLPAALLHDIAKAPKIAGKRENAGLLSAAIAKKILTQQGYPKEKISHITHAIEAHSFSGGIRPTTLEAKILRDVDRLDALGAIGIARAFSTGTDLKRKFYNSIDPFCARRVLQEYKFTIDHFYTKLLKLQKTMHITEAKKIARQRTRFMLKFLRQLKSEI